MTLGLWMWYALLGLSLFVVLYSVARLGSWLIAKAERMVERKAQRARLGL